VSSVLPYDKYKTGTLKAQLILFPCICTIIIRFLLPCTSHTFSINSEKRNRQNLELIENALLVVCFDDPLPASFNCRTLRSDVPEAVRGHIVDSRDETNMAHQMIHGGGSAANSANRWFDVTIQVRVSLNIKTIITL
jgi:hypothetical protein